MPSSMASTSPLAADFVTASVEFKALDNKFEVLQCATACGLEQSHMRVYLLVPHFVLEFMDIRVVDGQEEGS